MPHIMGVGYGTIRVLFEGHLTLGTMALLIGLKLVMTAVTIGSGGSGGVFAPSLFIGAMLGGTFGTIVHTFFPELTAEPGAYILVGMAAVNGACTLAPLSAIIILVELTDNYSMILPLMLTVVMATFASRKLNPDSIYTEKLARRGINAHGGEDLNILRSIGVKEVLRHDEAAIEEAAPFESLVELALNTRRNAIFVLGMQGRFNGVVSMQDLKHAIRHLQDVEPVHTITDFMHEVSPVLETETLDRVIDRFAETELDRMPVVDQAGKLKGSVVMHDIVRCYNQEVANRNMAIELGARIQAHDETHTFHLGAETVVAEIDVPAWMVGKQLSTVKLRTHYNVSVLIVKEKHASQDPRIITPGPSYVFRAHDTILVGGHKKDIEAIE